MKLTTAMHVLIREVEFLGYKNLGELVKDMEKNPLAYPLRAVEAYKVYKAEAYL